MKKRVIYLFALALILALGISLSSCGPSAAQLEEVPSSVITIEKVGQNWLVLKPSANSLNFTSCESGKIIFLDTRTNAQGEESYFWYQHNQTGKISSVIPTNNFHHLPTRWAYLIVDTLKQVDEIAYRSRSLGPDLQALDFRQYATDQTYLKPSEAYLIHQLISYKYDRGSWFTRINYQLELRTASYDPEKKALTAPLKIVDYGPEFNPTLLIVLIISFLFPIILGAYVVYYFKEIKSGKAAFLSFWLTCFFWTIIFGISEQSFGLVTQTRGMFYLEVIIAIVIGLFAWFVQASAYRLLPKVLLYKSEFSLALAWAISAIVGSLIVAWNFYFLLLLIPIAAIGILMPWLWVVAIMPLWNRFWDWFDKVFLS